MREFVIRLARHEHVRAARDIDVAAWGEGSAATEEQMHARIDAFPIGNAVAEDRHGNILGSVWGVAIDDSPIEGWSWWKCTGEGVYKNATVYGDVGFGVNCSVRPEWGAKGVGTALIEWNVRSFFELGRKKWRFGGRIPEYHEWASLFTAEDYVRVSHVDGAVYFLDMVSGHSHQGPMLDELKAMRERDPSSQLDPRRWPIVPILPKGAQALDGELQFFLDLRALGLAPRIYRVQPEYFPDPPSMNYGVIMGADNPSLEW